MKKTALIFILFLCACQNTLVEKGAFATLENNLIVIGAVEPIHVLPFDSIFDARIDTGATTSAIDAYGIKRFERDGQDWVSFMILNKTTGKKHKFEKKIKRNVEITRAGKNEQRAVVDMDIKLAEKVFQKEFSLSNREKFEYQVLIGRNILKGNFVVDVSKKNTKY